jgi:hypothetical protein
MRDAQISRPVGREQTRQSSLAGFALILLLGLALLSTGCAQPDQGYPLSPSENRVRLPSLAPQAFEASERRRGFAARCD